MIENGQLPSKKVALVTGGSRGIGKDIALIRAAHGFITAASKTFKRWIVQQDLAEI